jgi:hypothetical protein
MVSQLEKTLRTLVYIDTEAYLWLAAEVFENNEPLRRRFQSDESVPLQKAAGCLT